MRSNHNHTLVAPRALGSLKSRPPPYTCSRIHTRARIAITIAIATTITITITITHHHGDAEENKLQVKTASIQRLKLNTSSNLQTTIRLIYSRRNEILIACCKLSAGRNYNNNVDDDESVTFGDLSIALNHAGLNLSPLQKKEFKQFISSAGNVVDKNIDVEDRIVYRNLLEVSWHTALCAVLCVP